MKGAKSKAGAKIADSKLSVKKSGKAAKDPNKPKRPASAFFVFMEEFRQTYKEKHPNNKSVAAVGKAAGEKWKSMSEADKAPYVEKSEKRKKDYEKNMAAYNKKQAGGADADAAEEESDKSKSDAAEEESDKSKSEVNDDDEDEDGSGEDDDDEDDD